MNQEISTLHNDSWSELLQHHSIMDFPEINRLSPYSVCAGREGVVRTNPSLETACRQSHSRVDVAACEIGMSILVPGLFGKWNKNHFVVA